MIVLRCQMGVANGSLIDLLVQAINKVPNYSTQTIVIIDSTFYT